jgi:hypothetical protein
MLIWKCQITAAIHFIGITSRQPAPCWHRCRVDDLLQSLVLVFMIRLVSAYAFTHSSPLCLEMKSKLLALKEGSCHCLFLEKAMSGVYSSYLRRIRERVRPILVLCT